MQLFELSEEEITGMRAQVLRKKMLALGPNTPPEIILELQEIENKKVAEGVDSWEDFVTALAITRNTVGNMVVRLSSLEASYKADSEARPARQTWQDRRDGAMIAFMLIMVIVMIIRW